MVRNFGELKHAFDDFLVLDKNIDDLQIKTLMKFSDISDTHGDEKLRLNGQKELTNEMLQLQIILGKYNGNDQGWGYNKGTMLFHVNDTVLHCQRPIRRNKQQEFQIYLNDAQAQKGDKISNRHHASGFGGHSLFVTKIDIFTLPYLFTLKKENLDFELGIIGYEDSDKFLPCYELSKYVKPVKIPKDTITSYKTPDMTSINSDNIGNNATYKIECQVNNKCLAFNINEAWETACPLLQKNTRQQFTAIKNKNGTFSIKCTDGYRGDTYLGIDKPTSDSDLLAVKLIGCNNTGENKNLQWFFEGDNLINVMGGYLTIPCSDFFSDDILFCTSKRENNNQKWKFIK